MSLEQEVAALRRMVEDLQRRVPARTALVRDDAEHIFFTGNVLLTSGTSWTVPSGVRRVCADLRGAGGGGGGGSAISGGVYGVTSGGAVSNQMYQVRHGGGGGSGARVLLYFDVIPGESIPYAIGTGGAGGTGSNYGTAGGGTTMTLNGITHTAGGGEGGTWFNGNTSGIYGRGGVPSTTPNLARRLSSIGFYGAAGDRTFEALSYNNTATAQATRQRGGYSWGAGGAGARDASAAESGFNGSIGLFW